MPDQTFELTRSVVSAYVSKNRVPASSLPDLIASVSASIESLAKPAAVEAPANVPAVNPKKSVTPDHIVCLEDGKKFKSLKRHLSTNHGMSPAEYRTKWRLPTSYPMVAPAYAAKRSELANAIGLGRKPAPVEAPKPARKTATKAAAVDAPASKKTSRPKAAGAAKAARSTKA